MAKKGGNPQNLKPFKPGQSGNPSGRPKGMITVDEVQALMGRFWKLSREELHAIVSNPKSSMGEIMVASVMAKAAKDGDYARLSFLLDRTVGKVKDVSEVHQHNFAREFEEAPREKLLELIRDTKPA